MCLIVFAHNVHPQYKLIFAANRDEFYERPTRAAAFWKHHPQLLAGKDMKEGGTWMGITRQGRFAAITNYRDMNKIKTNVKSRGFLVRDYLINDFRPENYANLLAENSQSYNGYNLIYGNSDKLFYYSNEKAEAEILADGVYGLSNHLLNTGWPKVERSKNIFSSIIEKDNIEIEKLFDLLLDSLIPPDEKLPETGLPQELERLVSTVFIKSENYGTRCSTVLTITKDNEVSFIERTFKPNTLNWDEVKFNFTLE